MQAIRRPSVERQPSSMTGMPDSSSAPELELEMIIQDNRIVLTGFRNSWIIWMIVLSGCSMLTPVPSLSPTMNPSPTIEPTLTPTPTAQNLIAIEDAGGDFSEGLLQFDPRITSLTSGIYAIGYSGHIDHPGLYFSSLDGVNQAWRPWATRDRCSCWSRRRVRKFAPPAVKPRPS